VLSRSKNQPVPTSVWLRESCKHEEHLQGASPSHMIVPPLARPMNPVQRGCYLTIASLYLDCSR
jgi:hypothetical protein